MKQQNEEVPVPNLGDARAMSSVPSRHVVRHRRRQQRPRPAPVLRSAATQRVLARAGSSPFGRGDRSRTRDGERSEEFGGNQTSERDQSCDASESGS